MAEDRAEIVRRESRSLNPRLLLASLKRIREDREVATLLVAKGAREKCFYFTVGAIRMISVGPGEGLKLGRLLLSRGLISEADLGRAEARRRTMEVPLKDTGGKPGEEQRMVRPLLEDVLAADELVPRQELHAAVAEVVRWELEEIVFWSRATIQQWAGSPPSEAYRADIDAHKMSFGVYKMLEELEAIADRWDANTNRIVTGARQILPGSAPLPAGSPPLATQLAQAVEAEPRTLEELIRQSRHVLETPFAALACIRDLARDGVLRVDYDRAPPQLSKQRLRENVVDIEQWLNLLIDGLGANQELAEIYEKLDEHDRAVEFRRVVAERLAENGDYDGALIEFQRILEVSDKDFPAWERVIDLLGKLGRQTDLVTTVRSYASMLSLNQLFNRARDAWTYFLRLEPKDVKARRELVEAHLMVDDEAGAADELMKIYEQEEAEGHEEAAREALVDLIRIAPENEDYRRRFEVVTGVEKSRSLRRFAAGVAGLVILIGAVVAFMVQRTASRFVEVRKQVRRDERAGNWVDADQVLSIYLDHLSGPFTDLVREPALALQTELRSSAREAFRATYDQMSAEANWFERQNRVTEAIERLQLLERRLDRSNAVLCPDRDQRLAAARALLARLKQRRDFAIATLGEATFARKEGRQQDAYERLVSLRNEQAWLEDLREVRIPVRVETTPNHAQLFVEGVQVGRAPREVDFPIGSRPRFEVAAEGFERRTYEAPEAWRWPLKVVLDRKAAFAVTGAGPIPAPVVAAGSDLAIAGDLAGSLCAVRLKGEGERASGLVLWQRSLGFEHDIIDLAGNRRVLVALTGSGRVMAFDPESGGQLWSHAATGGALALLNRSGKEDVVLTLTGKREITARLSGSGRELWKKSFGSDFSADLCDDGRRLALVTVDGHFGLVDGATGTLIGEPIKLATTPLRRPSRLSLDSPGFAVALDDSAAELITAAADGSPQRARIKLPVAIRPELRKHGEQLYAAGLDSAGTVIALAMDGSVAWRKTCGSDITGPLRVTKSTVFVPCQTGLVVLSRETGEEQWRAAGAPIGQAPTITRGLLLVGDRAGMFRGLVE